MASHRTQLADGGLGHEDLQGYAADAEMDPVGAYGVKGALNPDNHPLPLHPMGYFPAQSLGRPHLY